MARQRKTQGSNGAGLGFEEKLWLAADKLRGHMDAAEYKHVVLGLIFLKYISDAFEEHRAKLLKARAGRRPRGPRRVPRRERLLGAAGGPLGPTLQAAGQAADHRQARRRRDGGHRAGEPGAQGGAAQGLRPPRRSTRPGSGELIDLIGTIGLGRRPSQPHARTSSAGSTNTSSASSPAPRARRGGEFYTPRVGRQAAGRDDRAVQGPGLRPVLRLGRHVRAVREVRRGPRRQADRPLDLRPGVEPDDVAAVPR